MNGSSHIALRYLQRRVLLLSMIPLGLCFALTVTLARTYHARENALVRQWFQTGNADLSAGQPGKALEDFRTALSYDPENPSVQLRLAEALLADRRFAEAHSYLVTLWDRTPGSGQVNLDLAHVSVQMGDWEEAVRYFQIAIYGSWDKEAARQRTNARLELSQFLLARGRTSDAQGELTALTADISPDDALLLEKTGRLWLRAGQPGKALAEFEAALRDQPRQSRLLEESGNAAFAAGDYAKADAYLARAIRENPSEEDLERLETAKDVLDGDPFQSGLSDQEQAQRSWRAFQQGLARLQECTAGSAPPPPAGQSLTDWQSLTRDTQELKERVNSRSLIQHPELREEAMRLVFRIEETAFDSCEKPANLDRALFLMGKRRKGNAP